MRVPTEFVQVEARGASYTRDSMVLAVGEEEQPLLGGENPRTLAVEMGQPAPAAHDGVVRRDHPRTLRAGPLLLVHY